MHVCGWICKFLVQSHRLCIGHSDFVFEPDDGRSYVDAAAGVYKLCFCRPGGAYSCSGDNGNELSGFYGSAGFLTIKGPHRSNVVECQLNATCTIHLDGVGLSDGDQLLSLLDCGHGPELESRGLPTTPVNASRLGNSYTLGFLAVDRVQIDIKGTRLCWCPHGSDVNCTQPDHFRAFAGLLKLGCPVGYYLVGSPLGRCILCTEGYYCPENVRSKVACKAKMTTLGQGKTSIDDCLCKAGAFWVEDTKSCELCEPGSFKEKVDNDGECPGKCPNATSMTTLPGAKSELQCVCAEAGVISCC